MPNDSRIHLIRVRNPWGDKNEWKGKYGDWLQVFECYILKYLRQ